MRPSHHESRGGLTRRGFLQVGYSGLLGLGLPGLLAGARRRRGRRDDRPGAVGDRDPAQRRARAARLVRHEARGARRRSGASSSRSTRRCPASGSASTCRGLAARADRLAIVRSMSHPEGNHLLAVHRVLTGQPSNPRGASDLDRVASRDDFPCYAGRARPRPRAGATASPTAWPCRPAWSRARSPGRARTPASSARGTTPGSSASTRTGPRRATTASPCPPGSTRRACTAAATCWARSAVPSPGDAFVDQQDAALAMLCNGRVGRALDLDREDPRAGRPLRPAPLRPVAADGAAAGRGRACRSCRRRWGSCRPGTPTSPTSPASATTSCPRSTGPSRPCSTTSRPRGLLDETLVVMLGEFGRTPRIHPLKPGDVPGRDHWPAVFPAVFAGGGVVGGPGHRQVRPARGLSRLAVVRPARPGRDDLPRPRRRPGDRAPRPPRPPAAALLGEPIEPLYTGRAI